MTSTTTTRKQFNAHMEAASRKIRSLTKTTEKLKQELDAALSRHQIAQSYQKIVERHGPRPC
jgi:arsenate reductase-like glutaredoxin family protein